MKKVARSKRHCAFGGMNLTGPTKGHETAHLRHSLPDDPNINGDAQRAGLSDDKTADNFVEFMSRASKFTARQRVEEEDDVRIYSS